jgi:hypothetical protein
MNTIPIRIKSDSKKELDSLMLKKALELHDTKYSYAKLIEELIQSYKENETQ